ncbi:MAG: hypothetical protein WC054_11475 [Candidatus Nanopelagicales bacterium]
MGDSVRTAAELMAVIPPLPDSPDTHDLIVAVQQQRGRKMQILTAPPEVSASVCGMWVETPSVDLVFIAESAAPFAREHVLLHEMAHMLLGHGEARGPYSGLAQLMPDLDPSLLQKVLGRSSYEDPQEYDAELLATLLQSRTRSSRPDSGGAQDASSETALFGRITTSRRWN